MPPLHLRLSMTLVIIHSQELRGDVSGGTTPEARRPAFALYVIPDGSTFGSIFCRGIGSYRGSKWRTIRVRGVHIIYTSKYLTVKLHRAQSS